MSAPAADPLGLAWAVFKATLLSTGGAGNLPGLHADLVEGRHWVTDAQMAEALALGQVTPGPNGLWVVCLGYSLGGVVGALASAVAVCTPPLFILLIERAYRRVRSHPSIEGFVQGLSLAVVGVSVVILARLLAATPGGVTGTKLLLAAAAFALMATRRVPVLAILVAAGIVGALLR